MPSGRRLALGLLFVAATTAAVLGGACGLTVTGEVAPTGTTGIPPRDGEESGTEPIDGRAPGDAADGSAGPGVPRCSGDGGLRGPALVESPSGDFCIDSTEVTHGQYLEFLDATAGDASFLEGNGGPGFPAGCTPFTSLVPGDLATQSAANIPVTGVDWCDAFAYCNWAGKRLCGGAPVMDAGRASEWFAACSNDGRQRFAYGNTEDGTACNVSTAAPVAVGSSAACTGGYPGLFDMVGNVGEWVDFCVASSCGRAGGWYNTGPSASCDERDLDAVRDKEPNVGIRCCF